MKLDPLEARWIATQTPTPKAQAATKTAVRYFKSYIGDVDIGEITPNDLFEFRDAVAVLPKSMPRVHRMMEFVDIHAVYADRSGIDRIAVASRSSLADNSLSGSMLPIVESCDWSAQLCDTCLSTRSG